MRVANVCLVFVILFGAAVGELIKWQSYVGDIAAHVVKQLEARQITGEGMPLQDFDSFINKSLYGVRAEGNVRFHAGFVARIADISLKGTSFRSANTDTESSVQAQLALKGMELFYDLAYRLTAPAAPTAGTLVLWLPETLFDLVVRRNLTTGAVSGSLRYLTTGNQNAMRVQTQPSDGYTQLVARELKQVSAFRQPIAAAIESWNTVWQTQLDRALGEIAFPQMCYYNCL